MVSIVKNLKRDNLFAVRSIKTVNYLVRNGHDIVGLEKDKNIRGRKNFLFLNTIEFQECLDRFMETEYEDKRGGY